jgi:Ca2+/Na+ antiporter
MAVSNAFGSNTFNIMVGLGWPWLLYIMFANDFQPYHGLRNDGILESVILMATVLIIFIVIVLTSDFTLYRWHGNLFLVLYVAYLAFAIGQVYL